MIEVNYELQDVVISALRYAIGRKTYITGEICDFIKKHPELINERTKMVMLRDLADIDKFYKEDDNIDRPYFIGLKVWLENLEVK